LRIKHLNLKAFGLFTEHTIEFDTQEPGLHIIFGLNEAGKSTTLRALKALLYGFPERTSDNFLHANDRLMIGGHIEGATGQELVFNRRKKRKADLLDLDGNPLDPGDLAIFLHGVEPALFESLYCIDHGTLVAGGEDILAQKGQLGQALFAAGTGISSLKKILDTLEVEADELFRDRGSKQLINQAINEYKNHKRIVRESSLLPSKWREHQKLLQTAEADHERLEEKIRQTSAELQRLARLNKAIPELAELADLQEQQQDLGDVVVLPLEFPEQLREVEQQIREIKLQVEKDKSRLEKLQHKKLSISVNQGLLDHAETIGDLHQRLDRYRKDQKDLLKLDGMRIAHRHAARALIENIRPGLELKDAESLRPVFGKKRTIQDLSSKFISLNEQASHTRKQINIAKKEHAKIVKTLSGQAVRRESGGLEKAITLIRKAGDIDHQIEEMSREIGIGKKSSLVELKRLGLSTWDLDSFLELAPPLLETVRRYETIYSELDIEAQQLKNDRHKAETELKIAKADNNEVIYGGEVPTEQELDKSRKKRQDGWRLLRRQWVDGDDVSKEAEEYEPGQPIHDAYEKKVEQADTIADRLRREARRVAKMASLRAKIESLEETSQNIVQHKVELAAREEETQAKWLAEWEPTKITPRTPKEMLSWLPDIDKLQFKVKEHSRKEREASGKDKIRQQYRKTLIAELKSLGESEEYSGLELTPIMVFAEKILDDIRFHNTEFEKLTDKLASVQSELNKFQSEQEEAERAKIEWQVEWDKALTGLKLEDQISPSEALDLLEAIGDCFDKLEKVREFQSRMDGMDRDVEKFNADVQSLLKQTALSLENIPPDQVVLQLQAMLEKTKQDNEILKKNYEEIEALTSEIEDAEKTLLSSDGRMQKLLAIAQKDEREDLAEAIRKSAEYQRLHEKISDAKSSLAKVSEGFPIAEIKHQSEAVIVDELPSQIASLNRQIEEELNPSISNALKLIGEETKELQFMDGSGQAAVAAEKMEQVAARIQRLVDQYTKIKLATKVLKDEIERYREEHQDPVLQLASKFFSKLTLDSFAGLRADMDDKGNPILIGIRPDDSRVSVEGMSDGTCDQLYLALRLATIESRIETSEPLPFIVDDILINFDDDRSKATLNVLATLSKKNQVILFTHHRRIVEEANKIKGIGEIQIHEV